MTRRSIRFRITTTAAAAVALVLIVAGFALVLLQRNALAASIDETLTQRADDIATLLGDGTALPDEFAAGVREGFAQLVTETGEVLVSTPNLAGAASLGVTVDEEAEDTIQNIDGIEIDDDVFRVLSRPIEGIGLLHVGTNYDFATESAAALTASLALTVPVVVVALGSLVWWLVGRTLRPVEDIRSGVAEVGSTDLHRRVPVPGTEDEIDRLAGTMNQMLERLEISVERQQRFVADASHELRSPLTRIRSGLEVDIAASDDLEEQERLRPLLDEVVGMQNMVEDLLYLARANAEHPAMALEPLDFDDLVLREASRVESDGRVEVDISTVSGAHVKGDRGQLTRALKNLLDNAQRHATRRVALSLEESSGWAVLVVADDGPGIPESETRRIFERFARLDDARSVATGGTGLGLAIAREIVERHHGSITLVNAGEPGAAFEVRIPLAD